jgi:hypothetical protein
VREPEIAAVEEFAGMLEVAATFFGGHRLSVISLRTDN